MLANVLSLLRRRSHGARPRRFGDTHPLADEVRHLGRRAVKQGLYAAAHGMTHDDDLAHAQCADREFDGGADAVRLVVGAVRRCQIGDVAHHEKFARRGIEHHLRIGAAV